MRQWTTRLAHVFLVKLLHEGVLVALADRFLGIRLIEGGSAFLQDLHTSLVERLSAATDATTRAGHHLDRMIGRGAILDLLDQLAGVA